MQTSASTMGYSYKALLRGGVLLLGLTLTSLAWASGPKAKAYDRTYGEWSAAWWQWARSFPSSSNPLTDTTGEDCDQGQLTGGNNKVWFLAGTTGGSADRHCTVPQGKALLYPLVNAVFINSVGENFTVPEKQAGLADFLDLACRMQSTVDGASTVFTQPTVRTQSPLFTQSIGPDDVYGAPEGVVDHEALSDGYWVILPPLAVGTHTLTLQGALCHPETHLPFFETQVTYHLTIAPNEGSE